MSECLNVRSSAAAHTLVKRSPLVHASQTSSGMQVSKDCTKKSCCKKKWGRRWNKKGKTPLTVLQWLFACSYWFKRFGDFAFLTCKALL